MAPRDLSDLTTTPSASRRVAEVQAPVIPIVGELTQAHPGTISLGQGVVAYPPPQEAMEAIPRFAAQPDNHKYKLVQGIPELLDAIESKLKRDNNIHVDAKEQVVVTAGSNMGFNNALLAIADPGDEIILPAPYYFNHEMAIRMANCIPRIVPTDAMYRLDTRLLTNAITAKTKAIVTISPNNPSGAIYPSTQLSTVNHICQERGIYHISDEAYEYFTYDDAKHFSPASIDGATAHTISLFSLSKAYGFASWRIGYMVIPPDLMAPIKKIQDTILICPPVISQYAACGALSAGEGFWGPKIQQLQQTRRMVRQELQALPNTVTVSPSQGAFYFLLDLKQKADPMDVIRYLIQNHRVAAIPGTAFGLTDSCTLRIAFAALPSESIRDGLTRLVTGIHSYFDREAPNSK